MMNEIPTINRELSWLSFNERVLQEAESTSVPVVERLKFLGIFSNNLDEFFRVRVATIKNLMSLSKSSQKKIPEDPAIIMHQIQNKIKTLQTRYNNCYKNIIADLEKEHIFIINENDLSDEQGEAVKNFYHTKLKYDLFPILLDKHSRFPILNDSSIYLAIRFYNQKKKIKTNIKHALLEIPATSKSRFYVLPKQEDGKTLVMFIDDVIRYNLKDIFKIYDFNTIEAYTFKFTRNAELDIDNDVSMSILDAMKRSLKKRVSAEALRFLYDEKIPNEMLQFLIKKMNLNKKTEIFGGARYHNFKDFMRFPDLDNEKLIYQYEPQVLQPDLENINSILDTLQQKDILLYFPYHPFGYFLDLLREAAIDPKVSHIRITLYRLASQSNVIKSLITALQNGKDVTVFIELKARFDEAANIKWANILRDAGAKVITGINGLKVHSKLCLITRRERGQKIYYASIGTGNMHEKTARIYTDCTMFTANQLLTKEARMLFDFFEKNYVIPKFHRLLVAPFNLRAKLIQLINREIRNAKQGKPASIFMKMNSLVDEEMIAKLYQASKAGVQIRLIVRGICSLIPELPNYSEHIKAISIIDKFLEHSRIFIFENEGDKEYFFGSADLMTRNLDFRVEVICPVYDETIKQQLQNTLEKQWQDNTKARVLDKHEDNRIVQNDLAPNQSQQILYQYWKDYAEGKTILV